MSEQQITEDDPRVQLISSTIGDPPSDILEYAVTVAGVAGISLDESLDKGVLALAIFTEATSGTV